MEKVYLSTIVKTRLAIQIVSVKNNKLEQIFFSPDVFIFSGNLKMPVNRIYSYCYPKAYKAQ